MRVSVSKVLLRVGVLLILVLMSNQALATTCPDGVEPVDCQTSEATEGNIRTGTSEQAKPMVDDMESMMASMESAKVARMWSRLYYIAPLIPFLMILPLVLTYLLMRKPRRSVLFDIGYGLVCGSVPLGLIVDDFLLSGGFSHAGFLVIILVWFLIIAVPVFFLSLFSKGRKSFLWGGAIVSSILCTALYILVFVWLLGPH